MKTTLFCAILSACLTFETSAQECEVLKVAGTSDWLPLAYVNDTTTRPEGIAYDLARIAGTKLNIPVAINANIPWDQMLVNLEQGSIDMVAALYWNKERAINYQYSTAFFQNEARVFVAKGREFAFDKFDNLIGRTGGIPPGTVGEKFETFAVENKLNLKKYTRQIQMVEEILQGKIDYFIADHLDGTLVIKNAGLQGSIIALPLPVSKSSVHFALSRQSPCQAFLPQINASIEAAKRDGTLQALIDKYVQ